MSTPVDPRKSVLGEARLQQLLTELGIQGIEAGMQNIQKDSGSQLVISNYETGENEILKLSCQARLW